MQYIEKVTQSMATSESEKTSFSSSIPELKDRYDVFLSFRGPDTRKKFTDHLYHALMREGYQTFRDGDEIGRGTVIKLELQKAIMNAKMSVIVLSENYAKSMACLFELQTILEHYKKSDHFVLPIFYEVDPWEVEEKGKHLDFGEKEVTVEKVKRWSVALKEVASMNGMVFPKESDGYEAKFVEEIVAELKTKLAGKHMTVGDHLVSMDSRIKRVNSWLKNGSLDVRVLLICGMGGIGKTTIAKVAFNSNHGRYDAASFLSNISGVAKRHGLAYLQTQLLSDILKKKERKVKDVDDGFRRMVSALKNKRVLLVLDDVDQREQLTALAGQQNWFSRGSKFIITTRVESVMNADHEVYEVFRLEKLSNVESLELFSWHAFGQKYPVQSHMDLSKRFVQYCDGIPLALELLGCSVRRKNIDVLESELKKLEANRDSTILEKLEISYSSLKDDDDKNLFLDIACFFIGKKKNETITVLEGCGYSALAGIHNLVVRNLLAIKNGKVEMHRLLQDMGKQIVHREAKYPERRSRIWSHEESFTTLVEKIGTEAIEGLVLDMNKLRNSNSAVFEANTFEKMYNLRLLELTGVKLSGTYKAFPKRLRWLYWRGFPLASFPSDFPLENLVSLDMRYSNFKQVWKGTKVLGALKTLNLSHSPKLAKTPNFSGIPNLEKLILKDCPSLFKLHESIVELKTIQSLILRDCKNLRKLPSSIGMVESLLEIDISGCSNLMGAIEELEKMKSLQVLKASGMDINRLLTVEVVSQASIWPWIPRPRVKMSLASLPNSLVRLSLSGCNLSDEAFPRDLTKLSKLQRLSLSRNPISILPDFIKDLSGLQTLDLSWCKKLQQIRWSSTNLHHLDVLGCAALEEIKVETATDLRDIISFFCWNLNHFKNNFKFLPVREVDVELLNIIGFFNLDSMANVEVTVVIGLSGVARKLPIQIIYKDNAFSTFFPGREVPHWFSNKNDGSTVSFTATLSPHSGFRGLNLCAVYTLPEQREHRHVNSVSFTIKSKSMWTRYKSRFCGIPEKGEDMVWLSHCFQPNMFTEDDDVEISFWIEPGGHIKECGVHPLYFEEEGEVFEYVSTIQRSWDPNLSPYEPESEATERHRVPKRKRMG